MLSWQKSRFLKEFSPFGIGGPIRYFAEIQTEEEMREAFSFCREKKLPFLILGKGSNCLFDDRGFAGAVLLNRIDFCNWDGSKVFVGAGSSFSLLGIQSAKRSLGGLEFASGIPATVGGAIWMNAGAGGSETSSCLHSVQFLGSDGVKKEFLKAELHFGYRSSSFQKMEGAILAATFALPPSASARTLQRELVARRIKTQPLQEKNIGCIFRNPAEKSAGALIEECGLKGLSVGGALVSEKHANFIINQGDATSGDVLELIALVQKRVCEKSGIHLEKEIRVV